MYQYTKNAVSRLKTPEGTSLAMSVWTGEYKEAKDSFIKSSRAGLTLKEWGMLT